MHPPVVASVDFDLVAHGLDRLGNDSWKSHWARTPVDYNLWTPDAILAKLGSMVIYTHDGVSDHHYRDKHNCNIATVSAPIPKHSRVFNAVKTFASQWKSKLVPRDQTSPNDGHATFDVGVSVAQGVRPTVDVIANDGSRCQPIKKRASSIKHARPEEHFRKCLADTGVLKALKDDVKKSYPERYNILTRLTTFVKDVVARLAVEPFIYGLQTLCAINIPCGRGVKCRIHVDVENSCHNCCQVIALGYFQSRRRYYLVLWPVGIILEVPPGSIASFPSAFIDHSNIHLADFLTEEEMKERLGDRYQEETLPVGQEERWSIVFFTQGSLMKSLLRTKWKPEQCNEMFKRCFRSQRLGKDGA